MFSMPVVVILQYMDSSAHKAKTRLTTFPEIANKLQKGREGLEIVSPFSSYSFIKMRLLGARPRT